jgi:hypothetical protein
MPNLEAGDVAIIAWMGDINQGFYVVPVADVDVFFARYGSAPEWQRVGATCYQQGPMYFLQNLRTLPKVAPQPDTDDLLTCPQCKGTNGMHYLDCDAFSWL